jgi:PAS domain S-box-containing protein
MDPGPAQPLDAIMNRPEADELVEALDAVAEVLSRSSERVELVAARSRVLVGGRAAGVSYAELLTGATGPLVLDVLSELQERLSVAGGRLRRVEVRALHAEGLSMEKIARLLRVSRQRVSAIINSPLGERRPDPDDDDYARSAGLSLTDSEFKMIAEALPHIVWVASADGATEYFNRQGTDYTGRPRTANENWAWVSMVHPEDQEEALAAWQTAVDRGTVFEHTYRICRHDGEYRWHSFRSLPVRGTDDQIVKWIGTATDIHDQLRLESELREVRLALERERG